MAELLEQNPRGACFTMKSLNFLIQAQEAEKSSAIKHKKLKDYIKEHKLDVSYTFSSMELQIGKISDEHLKNILAMI